MAVGTLSEKGVSTLCDLVDYAAVHGMIDYNDRVWAYNTELGVLGVMGPGPSEDWALDQGFPVARIYAGPYKAPNFREWSRGSEGFDLDAALQELVAEAVAAGVAQDTVNGRDRMAMLIMGVLTPRPSEGYIFFNDAYAESPKEATDEFYDLCCNVGYVRRSAIARNIGWTTPTRWGDLEITINLSKPEKDPRDIAAVGAAKPTGEKYPACQLCIQNEGYPGRGADSGLGDHPARNNLRIIPIELGGERWGLQYSPYAYFNEHCIAMSSVHRPMHIDRAALSCLLDFVDLFPHYFIGSNADLPIVGGSILSHDHFQGGGYEFPMMRAAVSEEFAMPAYPNVKGAVLEWPLSVLRLRSADRAELLKAAVHVVDAWRAYSDEGLSIVARTPDGVPHNTVTPVVRRVDENGQVGGENYECYLALRCNLTSEEHPLGIFHPHAEWHHIKKENIGLIEVMGLAILPPRLIQEQAGGNPDDLPRDYIGEVFGHVLEDAGVFKWDEEGRAGQRRFLAAL